MFFTSNTERASHPFAVFARKSGNDFQLAKRRILASWVIEHLGIRPYQQILEVNCGSGYTLQEVSAAMKGGFLAATEPSLTLFRKAMQRNKKAIKESKVQIHAGSPSTLPYPHQYFHSIYGSDLSFSRREWQNVIIQLAELLRSGGNLILLSRTSMDGTGSEIYETAQNITDGFAEAGLNNILSNYLSLYGEKWILIKATRE